MHAPRVIVHALHLQALAQTAADKDAMAISGAASRSKASRGRAAAVRAAPLAPTDRLYALSLHERHALDPPDARGAALADDFAGLHLAPKKGQWAAPALPMCGPPSE
jgi:hypothetical protein